MEAWMIDAIEREEKEMRERFAREDAARPRVYIEDRPPPGWKPPVKKGNDC